VAPDGGPVLSSAHAGLEPARLFEFKVLFGFVFMAATYRTTEITRVFCSPEVCIRT